MEIKLERLNQPKDLGGVSKMLESRMIECDHFRINMEDIEQISLASFNALVNLYVNLARKGKKLSYIGCNSERMKSLIQKTKFGNVFISD